MLSKILLSNFRNFSEKLVHFSPNTTVIIGPNATGKTNILESVNLLATGKSFKARRQDEMINYDAEIARVKGRVEEETLEVILTHGQITRGTVTQKAPRKRLLVNNTGKRVIDFTSFLSTVVFRPQDLDLITASPSIRRAFLDDLLSQVDREYRRSLLNYEKGLRRRNKVLIQIREEGIPRNALFFWDNLLLKNGDYLTKTRQKFLDYLNLRDSFDESVLSVDYDHSVINEDRLAQYAFQEVAAGTTLVGPHRDDIIFKKNEHELDKYGSRGEQRMAVLWAKLAELDYLRENSDKKPMLLLDDIFSELDHEHRKIIKDVVKNQQTIITAADPHYIEELADIEKVDLAK